MKKSERIDALEREVDQLHITLAKLSDRVEELRRPPAEVKPQPFGDRVRSEFAERWGWLLEAAGL